MTPADPRSVASTPRTRRGVVEFILGAGVLGSLVPPAVIDMGGDTVVAAKVGDLKTNGSKIFRIGNRPGLLLLTPEGEYRAMSATCTHLSCTVQYRHDLHEVWCACHNGIYDLNGRNISGPPPRPLESFQ